MAAYPTRPTAVLSLPSRPICALGQETPEHKHPQLSRPQPVVRQLTARNVRPKSRRRSRRLAGTNVTRCHILEGSRAAAVKCSGWFGARRLDPLPLDECPFGSGFRGELLWTCQLGLLVPADRQAIALQDVDGVVGLPFVGAIVVGYVDGLRCRRGVE